MQRAAENTRHRRVASRIHKFLLNPAELDRDGIDVADAARVAEKILLQIVSSMNIPVAYNDDEY